jgi:hypothetical protein
VTIAAETTGRVRRGLEFDPLSVDVVVRRYEAATDNPPVLIETGEATYWPRKSSVATSV